MKWYKNERWTYFEGERISNSKHLFHLGAPFLLFPLTRLGFSFGGSCQSREDGIQEIRNCVAFLIQLDAASRHFV